MAWAYSEALHAASVFPLTQFIHILSKIMSPQEGSRSHYLNLYESD
jgi:hypothetical protein